MKKHLLLKLADHLERGQLGHKNFDYNAINLVEQGIPAEPNGCGSSGCALGEMPIVFPDDWEFVSIGSHIHSVTRKKDVNSEWLALSVAQYFEITCNQVEYLFCPASTINPLFGNATRHQVAQHIRDFVERNGQI